MISIPKHLQQLVYERKKRVLTKQAANLDALDNAAIIMQTYELLSHHSGSLQHALFDRMPRLTCPTPLPRSTKVLPAISHSSIQDKHGIHERRINNGRKQHTDELGNEGDVGLSVGLGTGNKSRGLHLYAPPTHLKFLYFLNNSGFVTTSL